MNGSIRSKGAGKWELVYDIGRDPLTNRRRQRSRTFEGSKRQADKELRRLVTEIDSGRLTDSGTTVTDMVQHRIELIADRRAPSTIREYRRILRERIDPAIGDTPLTKLTTQRLDDFYRALERDEGLKSGSIHQIHTLISSSLKQAVKWGWLEHNVAANTTRPPVRHREAEPPSMTQVKEILANADEGNEVYATMFRLAIATGMCRGELAGLKWSDLDVDTRKLRVRRAISTGDGVHEKSTKSGRNRRMTLDRGSVEMMSDYKVNVRQRSTDAGYDIATDAYIFSHQIEGATPVHPDNVSKAFERIRGEHGSVRLHDLRHAHATQLIANGVDIPTVSKRLGHEKVSTTLDIYAHVLDENDDEAADIIGGLLK